MLPRPPVILNVDDARAAARRRLPCGVFEYVDRGSEDEVALRDNRRALDRIRLVPRGLVDVSLREQSVTLFGTPQPCPIVLAPTAVAGLLWHDGVVELARAAAAHGAPFCVSTQSITPVEHIAAQAGAKLWFQLYVWNERQRTFALVDRARRAGAEALVLTVDTAVAPNREYNVRNGFGIPLRPTMRAALDVLGHPVWSARVLLKYLLTTGVPTYAHYPDGFRTAVGRAAAGDSLRLAADVTWDDVRELRRRWSGRFVLKGVLSVEDARTAVDCGADGLVVSNHGGRNLDCAPSPADVLARIVDAVGDRVAVLADSGVRRGSDIAKLLALGSQAVLVGRAPLYGLAVGGAAGAEQVLRVLRAELDTTMALLGVATIAGLRRLAHIERGGP